MTTTHKFPSLAVYVGLQVEGELVESFAGLEVLLETLLLRLEVCLVLFGVAHHLAPGIRYWKGFQHSHFGRTQS